MLRRLLLVGVLVALVGCGGDEPQAPPAPSRSPSELCPSLLRRLEEANEEVDRYEGTNSAKLEKATREYLKLRVRAAAQGCLTT